MEGTLSGKRNIDDDAAREAMRRFLVSMGVEERDGIKETPARVVRAWRELLSGYDADPAALLATTFDMGDEPDTPPVKYNGVVLLRRIDFASTCEHHLLPFVGVAHVAYLPGRDGRVVGLSKLARLVHAFARRLQCQERLTAQVADALEQHLNAAGVMVVVSSQHQCMSLRGVKCHDADMITSEVRGAILHSPALRAEIMALINLP